MLALNPAHVKFGDQDWPDVSLIAIDRAAVRLAAEWTDLGPHPAFADCPEQRVDVKIVRAVTGGDLDAPRPGDAAPVSFFASPRATDAGRKRVSFTGVVVAVRHEVNARGATRTVQLVALSADGVADPVTIADAETTP